MEFITVFREFGYPAVVTGALLWLYVTELKVIVKKLDAIDKGIREACMKVDECRKDINDLE